MTENEPYNENAVSTLKTLTICLKGMLSIVPKHRTAELTQAISVCRKQIQNTIRIKYTDKPKKILQPFNSYSNNNDLIKKKQSSLLTAALLAASKENSPSSAKPLDQNNINNESKIISISIPSNSLHINNNNDNDNNGIDNNLNINKSINNKNNHKILSSSNSSISIPIEITNNSISIPKNSFNNKSIENSFKVHSSNKKEHYLCTCSHNEKEKQKQKSQLSLEIENSSIKTHTIDNSNSNSNSQSSLELINEPLINSKSQLTTDSQLNSNSNSNSNSVLSTDTNSDSKSNSNSDLNSNTNTNTNINTNNDTNINNMINTDSKTNNNTNVNTNKMKKSHSFIPFFFSSYLSSSKSKDNKSSDSKNSKEKTKNEGDKEIDNNDNNNNENSNNNNNNNNNHFTSKYFISIPNRKDKIEITHSLPDLIINKPSTSTLNNSFTLSSLNLSSSHSMKLTSDNLKSSFIQDDNNKNDNDNNDNINNNNNNNNNNNLKIPEFSIIKGKKPDIPKVSIMKHDLSSEESLKFNDHLYEQQNDDYLNSEHNSSDEDIETEIICKHCGGIIKNTSTVKKTLENNIHEEDITLINTNKKKDTPVENAEINIIDNNDEANKKKIVSLFNKKKKKIDDIKVNVNNNNDNSIINHNNNASPVSAQTDININHITTILSESTVLTVSDANDENFLDLVIITASEKNGLFSKLPVELIIYIFSFFRSQSDLLSLTLVNRAIGACAKTLLCGLPRLHDNDHMRKFFKVATPNNLSLLNCVRSLQLPDIKQDIIPKDFATIYPPLLTNLQHLSFYINEDKQDTLNENFWLSMFKEFHQLRSVCLANRSKSVTDTCIRELIKNNAFLNVLDLENVDQLTDDAFEDLSEHYQLQVLSLGNCTRITDKTLFNLSSSPDILYLSVDNCWRVTDEGLKRFAETHSLVKVFRAYGCANLTDNSVSALGKHCKKLEVIDIGGTLITDVAIISIAEGCPNLVMLQIDENGDLTNKSIAFVGTSCKKLESIYLPDQITDDGVIPIAQNCKGLQEITLDCLSITDNTLEALAQCAELECISIRGCTDITEKGIDYLTKRCKLLYKIYVDDETSLNEKRLAKKYITRKSPQDFVICRCSCKEFPNFIVEHDP